jgi:hypothetical protein
MHPAVLRLLTAIKRLSQPSNTFNGFEGLASMHTRSSSLADDLIWGCKGISLELFGSDSPKFVRKTFYLLERGLIDAEKVGDQWVGSRQRLHMRFGGGEAA